MKKICLLLALWLGGWPVIFAQLTLDDCQRQARENYPLIRKYRLIEQSKAYTLSNVSKAYLPQFQLNARATYQSEVTSLPISLPGIEIPSIKKDQYQATLDATQTLWDGGAVSAQKKMAEAGSEVDKQQLAVDIYALEDRINQLFFGILSLDAQWLQNQILLDELQRNYTTINSYVENGIANQSDLNTVKVEQLNALQIRTQLQATRRAFVEMLSVMTGEKLPETVVLEKPAEQLSLSGGIYRPELQLFEAQNNLFDSQKAAIQASYMPKIGLFLQGGYGRPGLNMLTNEFKAFYMGGIRLTWNFGSLYTRKNDWRKIANNQNAVDIQKDVFLYNLNLATARENQDISRLREMMKYDDEIISLRESIRKAAEAKVANGTLTVTELMQEISRENLARQTQAAHKIDLLTAIYQLKNTTNNK